MVPQTVRLGMVDARRVAVVVICRDVQVGVGVLDVVMVTTESAYLHYPFTSLTFNDPSSRDGGGQNPGNNLHVSGLSSRVDTRDLEAAFAKIGRVSESSCHVSKLISTYHCPG